MSVCRPDCKCGQIKNLDKDFLKKKIIDERTKRNEQTRNNIELAKKDPYAVGSYKNEKTGRIEWLSRRERRAIERKERKQ